MTTIVITEKTSQAKDVQAAVGSQFGEVYPAQGHLLTLQMPEDVKAHWDWKNWDFELLRPDDGFWKTKIDPKAPDNVKRKLSQIEAALKTADTVIIATDCDREGEGIGREITDYFKFTGTIQRAMFTATDPKTLQKAFNNLRPAADYEDIYQSFIARQQGDQIYNLTLTRSATKSVKPAKIEGALGIGRVKTPTLGILCQREKEIENFKVSDYFEIRATATVSAGTFEVRHDPERYGDKTKLLSKSDAESIVTLAANYNGPISLVTENKRRGPPKLLDLPQMQKICGSRFGWKADKTLEIAQALYDTHKVLTYPRAEAKYLTENHIDEVPDVLAGLGTLDTYKDLVPTAPEIRKGRSGHFCDKCLEGVSHHAVIPNVAVMDRVLDILPNLSEDEKILFDLVTRHYIAAVSQDWTYDQTIVSIDVSGKEFKATGNVTLDHGWKSVLSETDDKKEESNIDLPAMADGEDSDLSGASVDAKKTKPPSRFNEGSLIAAMQDAWKFVEDGPLKERLKEAKGIGTPATRGEVIEGLHLQKQIMDSGKHVVPTAAGMEVYELLLGCAPDLVDPGNTAKFELLLDAIATGETTAIDVVDQISSEAEKLMQVLLSKRPAAATQPSEKQIAFAKKLAVEQSKELPENCETDRGVCSSFIESCMKDKPAPEKRPPSEKQIEWVKKLMKQHGDAPKDGWETDGQLAGKYLDGHFGKKKGGKKRKK